MTGDVTINDRDAYTSWGVNLEDGALSALMTPPPMKDFVEGRSRLRHGIDVITAEARYDARELTLPFHIIAQDKEAFFRQYRSFCDDVLSKGLFTLSTKYEDDVVYHLVYRSCTQFRQFLQQMAVFSLKVTEPDPTDRAYHVS